MEQEIEAISAPDLLLNENPIEKQDSLFELISSPNMSKRSSRRNSLLSKISLVSKPDLSSAPSSQMLSFISKEEERENLKNEFSMNSDSPLNFSMESLETAPDEKQAKNREEERIPTLDQIEKVAPPLIQLQKENPAGSIDPMKKVTLKEESVAKPVLETIPTPTDLKDLTVTRLIEKNKPALPEKPIEQPSKSVLEKVKASMIKSIKSASDLSLSSLKNLKSSSASNLVVLSQPAPILKKSNSQSMPSSKKLNITIPNSSFSPVKEVGKKKKSKESGMDSSTDGATPNQSSKKKKKTKPPNLAEATPSDSAADSNEGGYPSKRKKRPKSPVKNPEEEQETRQRYYQNLESKLDRITGETSPTNPQSALSASPIRQDGSRSRKGSTIKGQASDSPSSVMSSPKSSRKLKAAALSAVSSSPVKQKTVKIAQPPAKPSLFRDTGKTEEEFKDSICSIFIHKTDSLNSEPNLVHPLIQVHVLGKYKLLPDRCHFG